MEIDSELLKVLMGVGFWAADAPHLKEAETIFEGILTCRPDSAYPYIGVAYVAMMKGQYQKAVTTLQSAPYQDVHQKEYRNGYLGMALKFAGYTQQAHDILSKIKENGTDETAVSMAADLLKTDFSKLQKF